MDVMKLLLLCVATALMCAALRVQRPELAMALSIAAGVMALIWALGHVQSAIEGLTELAGGAGLQSGAVTVMLRAAGVALLTEFAAQLCRDAGEGALAGRVEFGGRAALMAMCVPLVSGLAARLIELLP